MVEFTLSVIIGALIVYVAIIAVMEDKPIGCPFCGAPEPVETGWVRCEECGKYWERQ